MNDIYDDFIDARIIVYFERKPQSNDSKGILLKNDPSELLILFDSRTLPRIVMKHTIQSIGFENEEIVKE